ncbi:hypothetical protein L3Q65_14215 [Amycolatopsis sp. FU40]|uniref:hypothetical protein n=1 Tax=Amycolatopsis sp. FU40 TaxID=2914159 RepID=UPI001F30E412|nr:hypothetical protein [Amycolatopsis sp. FU40]UKD57826.1 hypothetical protein L3Q65_14215 [Amycolatopsis sp. FU40]
MADAPPPQTVYPNLTYEDPKAALEFLVEAFGFESHFVVDGENGVEHAQVRAEAAGGRILNPVHDSPAGVREYSCADPEGQVWTFSSYAGE